MSGQENAAAGGLMADACGPLAGMRFAAVRPSRGAAGKRLAADAVVTRRTAATGFSWRGPGAGGRNRMAGVRTRSRVGTVSQGVAGRTRRHASLPCLDTKFSCWPPPLSPFGFLVARSAVFWCCRAFQSNSKLACGRSARRPAENTQVREMSGPLARTPECMRIEENLAKSFPPHARGVRNQTGLLVVAAGGPSGWSKNTRCRPAGNTRMNEGREAAFGERENHAKLV
jgi:hypothetical protein